MLLKYFKGIEIFIGRKRQALRDLSCPFSPIIIISIKYIPNCYELSFPKTSTLKWMCVRLGFAWHFLFVLGGIFLVVFFFDEIFGWGFFWGREFEEKCCIKEFKILLQWKNSLTTLGFRYNGTIYWLLKPLKVLQCVHENPNFDISNFSHGHIIICLILQFSKLRGSILPHCEKCISSWRTQISNISIVNYSRRVESVLWWAGTVSLNP